MAMNKRGIFFTISAMFLLSLMAFTILVQQQHTKNEELSALGLQIRGINQFVKSVDSDIERGLFITSIRSLLGMQQYIATSGVYVQDTQSAFRELMVNGTVNEIPIDIMNDSTFSNWTGKIAEEAENVGISANFTINSLELQQEEPWLVQVVADMNMVVSDEANTASWSIQKVLRANISVLGLEDPLYTVETGGRVLRIINASPYELSYVQDINVDNLSAQISDGYYANSTGPSFLMRLEGNMSNATDGAGIESIVSLPQLQDQGLSVFERTSVDYLYFTASSQPFFVINDTFEEWFRLDDDHLGKYQAHHLNKTP